MPINIVKNLDSLGEILNLNLVTVNIKKKKCPLI